MAFPDNVYAPPNVYTQTTFQSPIEAAVQGARVPVLIGTANEVLITEDLQIVRGSSSSVDQRVPQEDLTGRAVAQTLASGEVVLGAFDGVRRQVQVRNYPIVSGDGSGSVATNSANIVVTINGRADAVLSVQGSQGIVELSTAPLATDDVRITYFFNRTDTRSLDDVSSQVTVENAVIRGVAEEPTGGFEVATGNSTLVLSIDGTETSISLGVPGSKTAATLVSIINGAAAGTSLVASLYATNFGGTALQLSAAQSLVVGAGTANTLLGLTTSASTNRQSTFYVYHGPIVDGSDGGVTTTDPGKVTARVDGTQVIPVAVNGTNRSVTLPFAPAAGSTVTIEYYHNTWQDTFDYTANVNLTEVLRAGIVPGNSDFTEKADFILKDDKIVWGTSVLVSAGMRTDGAAFFDEDQGGQVSTLLVDQQVYLEEASAVTDTSVSPPVTSRVEFDLGNQPTTGNGRNTPLGQSAFQSVANNRLDLPTNRPDLIVAYWGFSVQDALDRGPVAVTRVEGSRITLQDPVDVGASVYVTYYYSTLTDGTYTLTSEISGPSGVGTYFISDANSNRLKTPQIGVKGSALTGVSLEFPSGSELTPDVRIEGGTQGPVEETVTISFADLDDTLARYTVPGAAPYFTVQDQSDHARVLVDNTTLASGAAGIDLSRVDGVDGLGFSASLMGSEIAYTVGSGSTNYDVATEVNDSLALDLDGEVMTVTVPAQTGVNASAYVEAINTEAKKAENAPKLSSTTAFQGALEVTAGAYDQLVFHYSGVTNAATGPVTAVIAPGTYASPTALATAVDTALDTAVAALAATYDGLAVDCAADSEGKLEFTFRAADSDLGSFATGTVVPASALQGDTLTVGGVTLTAGLAQTSGGLDFDAGQARLTITPSSVLAGDTAVLDVGLGPVTLTASGTQTAGGLDFDEGDIASGTITAVGVQAGDTVTIGGVTLTAAGAQTPGGLDFNEGTASAGTAALASVELGDVVTVDTSALGGGLVPLTANSSRTIGGFDFDAGTPATGTVAFTGVRPASVLPFPVRAADTLTINGNALTAIEGARTPGADDFDAGTRAVANTTMTATVLPSTGVLHGDTVNIAGVTLTADSAQVGGALNFDAGTQATAVITVASAPAAVNAAATFTIDNGSIAGGAYVFSPAGGARTSGANDYDETLGTTAAIASDIVDSINDAANALSGIATAALGPAANQVTVTWTLPGAAANAIANANGDPQVTVDASFASGAGDEITTATSLVAAILDAGNGLSSTVEAHNSAGTLASVSLRAVAPGVAGNGYALVSSAPARIIVSGANFVGGVGTDDNAATDAAAAIADAANSFDGDVTVTSLLNTLTLSALAPGAAGNAITLAASAASTMALSGATLAGGSGTDITAATSLVEAINDAANGLSTFVTASNVGGTSATVTITAVTPGLVGDGVGLAESTAGARVTLSGANLAGGVGDDTTVAASIVAAITDVLNGLSGSVSASSALGVVTISASVPGNAGNTITLASSDAGRLAASGATLTGGVGTDISVASSLVAAINDGGNGLSPIVVADNAGGTSSTVTVYVATPGILGNSYTAATSAPARIALSGASFAGGTTDIQVATSIVNAISDAANGLTGLVSADNSSGTSATVTITAEEPGTPGNDVALASSDAVRLAVSGATLAGGAGLGGGMFEFVDASAERDFAVLAGLSTDALTSQAQTKVIHGDVARRYTVAGGTGALKYDRILLRNRIVPGSGSISGASQVAQTALRVEGTNSASETGLASDAFGEAGMGAVVQPATMLGTVGLLDGQVPFGTYGDGRDGQPVVRLYADGGTTAQNNVFRMSVDVSLVFAEFTDAAGAAIASGSSADVPLGPASIAGTVLAQLRAAATSVGLPADTFRQEGAAIRVTGATSRASSTIVVGAANSHSRLGFSDGATASRSSVSAEKMASALMGDHASTPLAKYLDFAAPSATSFAGLALAGVSRDAANASYLYLQSQAGTVGGLGVSSSVALQAPTAASWLLPGTGLEASVGAGATGEEGFAGFYVTSSDPLAGSGSSNTSLLNNGVGADGVIGQTYKDAKTGLTFTILPRVGNASYPTGVGATFTFEVRERVTTDSNIPVNAIPGLELLVTNTSNVPADDTSLVETFERGGSEPAIGELYYVTYNYTKTDLSVGLFSKLSLIETAFGAQTTEFPLSLAGRLALTNGAILVGLKQVPKEGTSTQGSINNYIAAIDDVEGVLPGGVRLDTLTLLRGDSQDLYSYVKRHADLESSRRKRAERTAILGVSTGTQPSEVGDLAEALSSRRLRLIYPDIAQISITDAFGVESPFIVDSTYVAAAFAGDRASPNIDVATPWTRARVVGFEGLARDLDEVEKNQVAVRGVTVMEDAGSSLRVRHGLTTELANQVTRIPTMQTIMDFVEQQTRITLDKFIGLKSLPQHLTQIEGRVNGMFKRIQKAQIINTFSGVQAVEAAGDPTTACVTGFYRPVFPRLYIKVDYVLRSTGE